MQSVYGSKPYDYRAWSVHYLDMETPDKIFRLNTSFPDRGIECNPTACHRGNWLHIVFSATDMVPEYATNYGLYYRKCARLDEAGALLSVNTMGEPLFNGFENELYRVFCRKHELVIMDPTIPKRWDITFDCDEVMRAAYLPEDHEKFLVTCRKGDSFFTILYHAGSDSIIGEVVQPDGASVYKCCLLGETMIHAVQSGKDFEDRELRESAWRIAPKVISMERSKASWNCAKPTRLPVVRADIGETEPRVEGVTPKIVMSPEALKRAEVHRQAVSIIAKVKRLKDDDGANRWIRGMVGQLQNLINSDIKGSCADKKAFRYRQESKIVAYWDTYQNESIVAND